ncbi:glycosyltransferase family 87 protein [Telmatospirillum sp. J64-1]|uniref:glycosyltransferase family 87 protein n=1 Tax=Telmatospirillum sp. J64-1 TaxID=2502183 RepID=UPI00115D286E|nr:glycosyltransferase family 87 protein [Telmatospirillum sp. J64-1]
MTPIPSWLKGRVPSLLAIAALLAIIVYGLSFALPRPSLMDYGSFFASGEAAANGDNPYGVYPLTFHVVLPGFESWNPNLNPPISLPFFEQFAKLDPHQGFRLWWAISFACYGMTVYLLIRRYFPKNGLLPMLWALALAGFWDTLVLGQIYVPLVLAAVGAWLLLDRNRPILAGLLIGVVVAVKPNFLVWPALLFLAGYYRPVFAAGASALFLSLIPLFLYGPTVYQQWVELILNDANRALFLTNASLSGLTQRLGSPVMGTVLSVGLLAGLALWVWMRKRRLSALHVSALGLLGALLASPIAWVHYTMFLLPVFFVLPLSPLLLASAVLLVAPVPIILGLLNAPWWLQATAGSVYGWAVLFCLVALLRQRPIHPWSPSEAPRHSVPEASGQLYGGPSAPSATTRLS